jgi:hypothetical protein
MNDSIVKQSFDYFIKKEQEGEYLKIPFELSETLEEIEKLIFSYSYPKDEIAEDEQNKVVKNRNIIDFGLYSPVEFLGASGSNRSQIQISHKSDPGFKNLERIQPGTWNILAGAYHVQDEGVSVQYTVEIHKKKRALYKGDTHTHTLSSDGSYSYDELIEKAEREKLDFLILSDHNNFTQNTRITGREKVTVIPGTEWTHYKGHANVIGVEKALSDPFAVSTLSDMQDLLKEAKNQGALVSVNHPFCPNCGWLWTLEQTTYDLVEIWNGGLLPKANREALEWWGKQLDQGQNIAIVGGSDFHNVGALRNLGEPCTGVWAYSNHTRDLLKAIQAGHSYISYGQEGPSILIQTEQGIQGDHVTSQEVDMIVTHVMKGDRVRLISDKETEEIICTDHYEILTLSRKRTNEKYYRVEIYREPFSSSLHMPISLSNPIYFE